jgi:hypothetical protein
MSSPTPWHGIVKLAVLATACMTVVVLWHVNHTGRTPLNVIQPGAAGPSAAVIRTDFPGTDLPSGLGLDGQQYYAMARDPIHLDVAARSLDRPAYRWQRPLYPWLARAVHPSGGGDGLIFAFVVVGIAALVAGGVAAGVLSHRLGGGIWPAAVFPLLPGAFESLRVSVSDALALALALAALALAANRRTRPAVVAAVAAVLAKETAIVVLFGWLLAKRDRRSVAMVVAAGGGAAWWAAWLRLVLPTGGKGDVNELGFPLSGLVGAVRDHWLAGTNQLGLLATVGALVVALVTLWKRGLRHPLGPVIALQLAFVSLMNRDVLGLDFGGTRSTMPLLALGLLALATPAVQRDRVDAVAPKHDDAGIVGPGVVSGVPANR